MNLKSFFIKCIFLSLTSSVCYGFNTSVTVQDINGENAADIVVFLTPIEGQTGHKEQTTKLLSASRKKYFHLISALPRQVILLYSVTEMTSLTIYTLQVTRKLFPLL